MLFSDDNPLQVSPISRAPSGATTQGGIDVHRRQKSVMEKCGKQGGGEEDDEMERQRKGMLQS